MKRTLIAIGVAILASMMWIPVSYPRFGSFRDRATIFELTDAHIEWAPMILQTTFVAVAAAVIVDLFKRKK